MTRPNELSPSEPSGGPAARGPRLRVGFLIDRWEPARGGAERALAALAEHLERRGHEVLAFAERADSAAPGAWRRVRAPAVSRAARARRLAEALPAAAARAGCDVTIGVRQLSAVDLYWPHGGVHAATLEARWRAAGELAPGAAPLDLAAVSARARGRQRTLLELERRLLEEDRARSIACVSGLVRAELARFYPRALARAVVIENGVDLERFHPEGRAAARARLAAQTGLDAARPILAFAARDPQLKGLPVLAQALAALGALDWQLAVAGPRRPAAWRRALARAGLARGRAAVLAELDTAELFRAADLLVHPTWRDTAGLVVLEALASGTPVVVTHAAGFAERVAAPELGTRVDCGDAAGLARAIAAWLERAAAGAVDRAALRAAALASGAGPWLAALEREVERLARAKLARA